MLKMQELPKNGQDKFGHWSQYLGSKSVIIELQSQIDDFDNITDSKQNEERIC